MDKKDESFENLEETSRNSFGILFYSRGNPILLLPLFSVVSAILCIYCLSNTRMPQGIGALICAGLFFQAFRMFRKPEESEKKKRLYITLAAVIIFIPCLIFSGSFERIRNAEEFVWEDLEYHEKLPEPEECYGEIVDNNKNIWVVLVDIDPDGFDAYKERCKEMGYDINMDDIPLVFDAYNEEGYRVSLIYSEKYEELDVKLYTP